MKNITTIFCFLLSLSAFTKDLITLSSISDRVNSHKTTKDILKSIEEKSPDLATKLTKYLASHNLLGHKAPRVILNDSGIFTLLGSPKSTLKLNPLNGEMLVTFYGKKILLKKTMGFDEIIKVASHLDKKSKFSFLSFIIQDSHAAALTIGQLLFAVIYVYFIYKDVSASLFHKNINNLEKMCKNSDGHDMTNLVESYNELSKIYMDNCISELNSAQTKKSKYSCEKINSVKSCFRSFIDQDFSKSNDTNRSDSEDWIYVPKNDTFITTSATSQ